MGYTQIECGEWVAREMRLDDDEWTTSSQVGTEECLLMLLAIMPT